MEHNVDMIVDTGGVLNVFRGGRASDGPMIPIQISDPQAVEAQHVPLTQIGLPGSALTQKAGTSFVMTSPDPNLSATPPAPNLIIGAPGELVTIGGSTVAGGAVYVSERIPVNGWDHADGGLYSTVDSMGTANKARITRPFDLNLAVKDPFTIRLIDRTKDPAELCDEFTVNLRALGIAYEPGDPTETFDYTIEDGSGNEFTLRLSMTAATADEYQVDFVRACSGAGCDFTGSFMSNCEIAHDVGPTGPIVLTRDGGGPNPCD